MQKETMPAVLETTTFGELPEEPKTNALPLRQGTYWLLDEVDAASKQYKVSQHRNPSSR
jgi:hypothetical protein